MVSSGQNPADFNIDLDIDRSECSLISCSRRQSFNVLVKEMQSLCLDVSLSNDKSTSQKPKNNNQENS